MKTFLEWIEVREGILDRMRRRWDTISSAGTYKVRPIGGKWYITIGHDKPEDNRITWDGVDYGPFNSKQEAEEKLRELQTQAA